MIRHALTALSIGMLIFFLYLLQYNGAFRTVTVGMEDRGPYTLIFKNHTGPYHEIMTDLQSIEAWAKLNAVDCTFTFGEFFDDPSQVEEGRLRSRTGCLIDAKNAAALLQLKNTILPADIKIAEYKKTKSVVALFSGSPGISPYKVYPKASDFIKKNNLKHTGSILEIYEVLGPKMMNTVYIWPVENKEK